MVQNRRERSLKSHVLRDAWNFTFQKKVRVIIERWKEISIFLSARADRILFNKAYPKSKTKNNKTWMNQNIHKVIAQTVPKSYEEIRVRCCLQEARKRKEVSKELPCLLKKNSQQECCQFKSSPPPLLHLPAFLLKPVATLPPPGA